MHSSKEIARKLHCRRIFEVDLIIWRISLNLTPEFIIRSYQLLSKRTRSVVTNSAFWLYIIRREFRKLPKGVKENDSRNVLVKKYFKLMFNRRIDIKPTVSTDGFYNCNILSLRINLNEKKVFITIHEKGDNSVGRIPAPVHSRLTFASPGKKKMVECRPTGVIEKRFHIVYEFLGILVFNFPFHKKIFQLNDRLYFSYGPAAAGYSKELVVEFNKSSIARNRLRLLVRQESESQKREFKKMYFLNKKSSPGRCDICGKPIKNHKRIGRKLYHSSSMLKGIYNVED